MKIIFAKTKKCIKFGKVKVKKEDITNDKKVIKKKKGHFKIRVEGEKIILFYKKRKWKRILDERLEKEEIVFDDEFGFLKNIILFVSITLLVLYSIPFPFGYSKLNENVKYQIEMGKELENIEYLIKNIGKGELKGNVKKLRMEIEKININMGPTGPPGADGIRGPCPVGARGPPGPIGVSKVKKEREKPLGPQGIGPCSVGPPGEKGIKG